MTWRALNSPDDLTASQKARIKTLWMSRRRSTAQIAGDVHVRAPEHVVANFIYDWRQQRHAARAA